MAVTTLGTFPIAEKAVAMKIFSCQNRIRELKNGVVSESVARSTHSQQ